MAQSMKKEIIICGFLFVLVSGVSSFALVEYNKNATLKEINIELIQKNNHHFLNSQLLLHHLKNHLGDTILSKNKIKELNLNELEQSLLEFSSMKNANVSCDIKGKLTAKVEVKEPIARIKSASGTFYLDSDGHPMNLSKRYSARALLVLGDVSKKDLTSIYQLITQIKEDDFLNEYIIAIKKKKNNYMLYTRTGEHKIELGSLDQMEEKFGKLLLFYQFKINKIGWSKYKIIDLKYKNQVIGVKS